MLRVGGAYCHSSCSKHTDQKKMQKKTPFPWYQWHNRHNILNHCNKKISSWWKRFASLMPPNEEGTIQNSDWLRQQRANSGMRKWDNLTSLIFGLAHSDWPALRGCDWKIQAEDEAWVAENKNKNKPSDHLMLNHILAAGNIITKQRSQTAKCVICSLLSQLSV